MMRVAFYAPMKAPTHPVPSGDRNIARALIAALTEMGAQVTVAGDLQTRDGKGDAAQQADMIDAAGREIEPLIAQGKAENWQAWLTYHNYYKAPDLIGPAVSDALGIPYLQVETTRARKRLTGPWARFAQAAEAATDAASVVFYFTARDAEALHKYAVGEQKILHLQPFLNATHLPPQSSLTGPMIAVGMMRDGDKLASYEIIAETLKHLKNADWALDIAGDGPARAQVQALMAPFDMRVRFLGQLSADALQDVYGDASLLLWPGVNEAIGMVYLEAQAAGIPVVAQDRPGMRDVLEKGHYPTPDEGGVALAACVDRMLEDDNLSNEMSTALRQHVEAHHLLAPAARTLQQGFQAAGVAL